MRETVIRRQNDVQQVNEPLSDRLWRFRGPVYVVEKFTTDGHGILLGVTGSISVAFDLAGLEAAKDLDWKHQNVEFPMTAQGTDGSVYQLSIGEYSVVRPLPPSVSSTGTQNLTWPADR